MSKRASRNRRLSAIEAAAPLNGPFYLQGDSGQLELEAQSGAPDKPKRFSIVGYTGGAMDLGRAYPVVVDIAGTRVPRQDIPILRQHDPERIVAHTDAIDTTAQRIKLGGIMSGVGAAADEVRSLAANGFPWQASIGASVEKLEFVDAGEKVKVNGRNFTGPIYVARATTLREVSFVPIGADTSTSASVAASSQVGVASMDPKLAEALKAEGFDPATITDAKLAKLKAMFAPAAAPPKEPEPKIEAKYDPATDPDIIAKRRANVAETNRINSIRRIVAQYGPTTITVEQDGEKVEVDLEAHAIEGGLSEGQTEILALRADRAKNTAQINTRRKSNSDAATPGEVIVAKLCISGNLPNIEKKFKPEVLEAADKAFDGARGFSIQELLLRAASHAGYSVGPGMKVSGGNLRSVMESAFGIKAHGFSTLSVAGILSNIANKFLLEGYASGNESWRMVSRIGSVKDLKTMTKYRMTGGMKFEKVPPGGELKHGKVGEQEFTNRAHTYGRIEYLTDEDIINDDLGALTEIPSEMGRGGIDALNEAFWTEWMENASSFYSSTPVTTDMAACNSNLSATSAIGVTGLTNAKTTFLKQIKPDGTPINVMPYGIVFPPELQDTVTTLLRDRELRDTTASTKYVASNPHAGMNLTPVMSPYLSNANITNYSTTTWYLSADPAQVAPIEVVFLNGQQTPVIESAIADFNRLGIAIRGVWHFGVRKQDRRGVVQCTA